MKNWYYAALIFAISILLSEIDFIGVKNWVLEKFKSEEAIKENEYQKIKNKAFEFFDKCDYANQLNSKIFSGNPSITELKWELNNLSNVDKQKLKITIKDFLSLKLKYYHNHLDCSINYFTCGKYEAKYDTTKLNGHDINDYLEYMPNGHEIEAQFLYFENEKLIEKITGRKESPLIPKLMENRYDLIKSLLLEYELIYKYYFYELFNEKLNFNGA